MRKITIALCTLFFIPAMAQDHFGPLSTSKRVGILNGNMNPSEFANLNSRFEIQIIGLSLNASNNKISFSDLDGENFEDLLFSGNEGVDFGADLDVALPGFAFKAFGFGFGLSSTAHVRANVNDIDPVLGRALTSDTFDPIGGAAILNYGGNQRLNATAWGEIGLSVARKVWENEKHRFNAGVTFKLLFPGSYGNVGLSNLEGELSTNPNGDIILNNPSGNLNIAYSGSLAENFEETDSYKESLFGGLNGFAGDIGVDYQLKSATGYKLKIGASIKNMGSMTFKDDGNKSTNYELTGNDINLEAFSDIEGIEDIEAQLIADGSINVTTGQEDFKVKLPTVFNLYADVKVISKLNVTVFMQQKMNDNSGNDQINAQNLFSITPRVGLGFFEAYLPVTFAEVSGTNAGIGFRLGGFFLGSNSALTALGSGKQGDAYLGWRFGFL